MRDGVELAVQAAGSMHELGRRLGIAWQSVQQWKQIPANRLIEIERVTGVPRERLRPDLYRKAK